MTDLKVHLMHAEVSNALERLSKLFKTGMKISFIARLPGNGEADVLIGDDHDADELIALVRRRFGISAESESASAQNAEAIRNQALDEAIAVVPGGSICDPQQVADAIRALQSGTATSLSAEE